MSVAAVTADVRGYYANLGVALPKSSAADVSVRCFAASEAHRREDRNPSCSVNLESGAWQCHGCGAHGGAYDAAIALGRQPREAMDLLRRHGLADADGGPGELRAERTPEPLPGEDRLVGWRRALLDDERLLGRLRAARGWSPGTLERLGVGWDGERVVIPVRDQEGRLAAVERYLPGGHPKLLAARGRPRLPWPAPEAYPPDEVLWLCEGRPDAISLVEMGLAPVGMPGTGAQPEPERFAGRRIVVCCDCDQAGRDAGRRWSLALAGVAAEVRVLDLDPQRDDGHDVTDLLVEAAERGETAQCRDLLVQAASGCEPLTPAEVAGPAGEGDKGEAPPTPGSSWGPVDLAAIIAAGLKPEDPFRLAREDGARLLYRGRIHAFQGEPEAGKGWLALAATAEHVRDGGHVAYLDFEDLPQALVARLLALGLDAEAIIARVHYVRPEEALTEQGWRRLAAILTKGTLAVVDGVTEAMTLQGLGLMDNTEIARWLALLPRRLRDIGATVVLIDHVTKDREARGRYALGGQHKLAGCDVAYVCEMVEPFGRGREGISSLTVAKDRPGAVRQHAADGRRIATVRLRSFADGGVSVSLEPPAPDGEPFRPTVLMERVSRAIEEQPAINTRAIRAAVAGKHAPRDLALDLLIREGYVEVRQEGQERQHFSRRAFRQDDESAEDQQ